MIPYIRVAKQIYVISDLMQNISGHYHGIKLLVICKLEKWLGVVNCDNLRSFNPDANISCKGNQHSHYNRSPKITSKTRSSFLWHLVMPLRILQKLQNNCDKIVRDMVHFEVIKSPVKKVSNVFTIYEEENNKLK